MATAVAIEMLHNAFLIHDDLEDESELRRGEPTLHRKYGKARAINAGDALALSAVGVLAENVDRLGHRTAQRIFDEFHFMSRQTVEGQAIDLGWRIENRLDLAPVDYLDMIMKKTCWYTTVLPLRSGALIGSRLGADVAPMIDFGFYLGAAFQIQDDLLNITGDVARYGKEPLGDIAEGKRTLMLIHLLAELPPSEHRWLEAFLAVDRGLRTLEQVRRVRDLMLSHGSLEFARQFALGVAGSAEAAFDRAFAGVPPSPALSFIHGLISYMVDRDV
jgi:geranylgeranyl diphosphate synthase type II